MLGGRKTIRTVLYMTMLSTMQCNERFGAFYRTLVAKGKHKKVALAACMRKMITVLNAMIRDECDWCESQIFLVIDTTVACEVSVLNSSVATLSDTNNFPCEGIYY